MATIDPNEALANAQALAASFAQQDPGEEPPSATEQVPGEADGDANPAKRKYEEGAEDDEAMRKRSSFTTPPDTNGVMPLFQPPWARLPSSLSTTTARTLPRNRTGLSAVVIGRTSLDHKQADDPDQSQTSTSTIHCYHTAAQIQH